MIESDINNLRTAAEQLQLTNAPYSVIAPKLEAAERLTGTLNEIRSLVQRGLANDGLQYDALKRIEEIVK